MDEIVQRVTMQKLKKSQLDYLNNLKIFLIVLVVLQHSAAAYTIGENWLIMNSQRVAFLKPMLTINSSFFMGLFFFISAFFVPLSLIRYDVSLFLLNKIKRLLIPTMVGILIVLPLAYYVQTYPERFSHFYINYFFSETFTFGHMWFLVQLFIYSSLFALMYLMNRQVVTKQKNKPLTFFQVSSFILILCILTMLVAFVSPINQWYGRHLVEPYHLPQYISLFILGIIAYQRDWLSTTSSRFGVIWAILAFLCIMYQIVVSTYQIHQNLFVASLWTSLQCVSLCVALIIFFREYGNYSNQVLQFLSDNAFAVYIFHVPIVVWMQRYLLAFAINPLCKFLITSLVSYFAAYALSYVLRRSQIVSNFL